MSWNPNQGQDPNQPGQYGGYTPPPSQPQPTDPYSGPQAGQQAGYGQQGGYGQQQSGQQYGGYQPPQGGHQQFRCSMVSYVPPWLGCGNCRTGGLDRTNDQRLPGQILQVAHRWRLC